MKDKVSVKCCSVFNTFLTRISPPIKEESPAFGSEQFIGSSIETGYSNTAWFLFLL